MYLSAITYPLNRFNLYYLLIGDIALIHAFAFALLVAGLVPIEGTVQLTAREYIPASGIQRYLLRHLYIGAVPELASTVHHVSIRALRIKLDL